MALYRKHVMERIHQHMPAERLALIRALCAEFMGTLFLTLIGCMSILPAETSEHIDNLLVPALCFSTVVASMVHVVGPTSGCNINPVVSLALVAVGRMSPLKGCFYFVAQILGGIAAGGILWVISPQGWIDDCQLAISLVNEHAGVQPWQACLCEIIITVVFLLVVLVVADPDPHKDFEGFAAYTVGVGLVTCIFAGGPYSGSSMNPARTFGPALVRWEWKNQWVWWVGPIVGSLLAAAIYQLILTQGIHKFDPIQVEEKIGKLEDGEEKDVELQEVKSEEKKEEKVPDKTSVEISGEKNGEVGKNKDSTDA